MEIDKTTYDDLSLFSREEEFSVFHKLNFTRTRGGRDRLLELFNRPFSDIRRIGETQQILSLILQEIGGWPLNISNGTVMVMEKFYETPVDEIPQLPHLPAALAYKVFHGPDYSLIKYSVGHFADFVRGMDTMITLFDKEGYPMLLRSLLQKAQRLLGHESIRSLAKTAPGIRLSPVQVLYYGYYIRVRFKSAAFELI